MGIRKKIIKKLPIFGRGQAQAAERANQPSKSETNTTSTGTASFSSPEPVKPSHPRGEMEPVAFIEKILEENRVVLFMKGSPAQPLCGFSANAAGILASTGHDFAHVDVIADYEIREQVKQFSQWPTLPQIYVDKEFIGGSDILRQMSADGSLQEMLDAGAPNAD